MSSSLHKIKSDQDLSKVGRILKDKGNLTRLIFLIVGIILIVWSIFLKTVQPVKPINSSNSEIVSFSQEPVAIDKRFLQESKKKKEKLPPLKIIIPTLNIDLEVKPARIIKGYWEVFPDTAGFGLGSAFPEEEGNQVIFAHARKGLFLPLKQAQIGQRIYIFTNEKYYQYQIKQIKEVLPSQIEVIAPTEETILTLYTCSGFSDNKRLIVIATKID